MLYRMPELEGPYPAYLGLTATGELARRAVQAAGLLNECHACPRACGSNRTHDSRGDCGVGRDIVLASYGPHHGEEDCLKGWRGSGTVFLAGCNLRCVFCQNWDISHEVRGQPVTSVKLAEVMVRLQELGCHNINWVSPSHVVPQLLEALVIAVERGLSLPIVYNSGGYDSVETLKLLEGIVDIYMPDFKFWDPAVAERLCGVRLYPEVARNALREMHRQVGDLTIDPQGLARRGLLVRHLVLPNDMAGTAAIAHWIASELSPHTYINLMDQYHPSGNMLRREPPPPFHDLGRSVDASEFDAAMDAVLAAGLHRLDHRQPVRRGWFH
ncbi:MAG TPA: radical SAM protein [Candidatus Paceibacterota bacterium]|nr:radical SAM protein [Candidatus Paceibacterota bacterium]